MCSATRDAERGVFRFGAVPPILSPKSCHGFPKEDVPHARCGETAETQRHNAYLVHHSRVRLEARSRGFEANSERSTCNPNVIPVCCIMTTADEPPCRPFSTAVGAAGLSNCPRAAENAFAAKNKPGAPLLSPLKPPFDTPKPAIRPFLPADDGGFNPFRTAVPFRGQTSQVVSNFSPKRGAAVLKGLSGGFLSHTTERAGLDVEVADRC